MPKPDGNLLPVPVLPGIREDVKQLAPVGSLAVAQNVRFGADEVYQRPGSIAVAPNTAGSVHEIYNNTQPVGLVTRVGDAQLMGIDGELFARDEISGTFQFAGIYSTCKPIQQRSPFPAGAGREFGTTRSGVAVNSDGYVLSFATSTTTVYWQIETPNGVRIYYGSETATKACAVAQGGTLILVVQNTTTLTAIPITIAGGQVATGTRTNVGTLTSASEYWDASSYDATAWFIVYRSTAVLFTLRAYNVVTTSGPGTTTVSCAGVCPVSLWGDPANGRAWVGWYNDVTGAITGTADVKFEGLTWNGTTWAVYAGPTILFSGVNIYGPPLFGAGESGTGPLWVVQQSAMGTSPYVRAVRWGWLDASGTPEATNYTAYHVTPISKPDARGRVWCITGNESTNWRFQRVVLLKLRHITPNAGTNQPTIELALDDGVAPYVTSHLPSRLYDYFHAVGSGSTAHYFLAPKVLQQGPGSQELTSVDLVKYVPSELQPHRQCDEYGLWTTIAGQPVQAFGFAAGEYAAGAPPAVTEHESLGAIEIGFAYRPAVLAATEGAGGNLTATGVYSWVFVYEWTDPLGQRHRSAPSAPYSLTLGGGNQQVTFSLMSLDWHQKILRDGYFDPAIVCYRTVNGGTTWFRETVPTITGTLSARGTNGVVTYTSGATSDQTDASISSSEVLYTDGGVFGNALAPACSFTCRTEERMACGGLWDPRILHFSKIIVPGEPIQFADSDTFRVLLPEACTGLAYQDGVVYAFGKRAVYAITGDGPNDQGVGLFSPPRAICRDAGCTDYRSIVESGVGIFFMAERGLHLIPRGGGTPQFVGAGIETTTAAFPYPLGAFAHSDRDTRTVRFLLSSSQYLGSSGSQRVLVYDVELSAQLGYPVWSYDTYARKLQACGVWSTPVLALALLTAANICAYREAGFSADEADTTPVAFTSEVWTNVIRPWGAVGWGMVRDVTALMSGTSGSPSAAIRIYQDGTIESANIWNWVPSTNAEESFFAFAPKSTKCSGFRIRQSVSSSDGLGFASLHAWQVDHEPLGERVTPAAERPTN